MAMTFCSENLVSSTPAEDLVQCSDALSAHLAETLGAADSVATDHIRSDQQQQQQQLGGHQIDESSNQEPKASPAVREAVITVPLNINGVETVLQIFRESQAVELASELCLRDEFGLEESSTDNCISQVG